jgi:hypothetical protein
VFESRELRDKETGAWRKMHNEELHNLYSSPNINSKIRSSRMRWVGHVMYMGEMRNLYRILLHILKVRDHLEELGIDGRILKCILGK